MKLKTLPIVLASLLCAASVNAATTFKLSHNQDRTHPVHKGMQDFADKAKELSKGDLNIRIYPNATLGNERESLELMNTGALQLVKVNTNSIESFAPQYGVFNLPYLFRDKDHWAKTMQSELGQNMLASSREQGFVGITYYYSGARSMYCNKAIEKPEDLAGQKVRVQSSPSAIALVNAIGGIATPMAQGEVYTAIQSGVIDCGENSPVVYADMGHDEVAKYFSQDEHSMVPDLLVMSVSAWDKLSDDNKKAIQEAAKYSFETQVFKHWEEAEKNAFEKMKKVGTHYNVPDKAPFVERVSGLYDAYYKTNPQAKELVEQIKAIK